MGVWINTDANIVEVLFFIFCGFLPDVNIFIICYVLLILYNDDDNQLWYLVSTWLATNPIRLD